MVDILMTSGLTFLATVCLHIVVWRIHRPLDYRVWLPTLVGIFVVGGGLVAAWLVYGAASAAATSRLGLFLEWAAIALLQGAVGVVYAIGYTLLLVGSPSLVILERLAAAPQGLEIEDVGLPMVADDMVGLRVDDLLRSEFITTDPHARRLTPKGRRLTGWILLYRHLIGLPDGEGG